MAIRETIFEDGDSNVSLLIEANYRDGQLWIVARGPEDSGIVYGTMLTVSELREILQKLDREADRIALTESQEDEGVIP